MTSYRRDSRKGGRFDHEDGEHDDALSAIGAAFWLARELKGRMGGYTTHNTAWAAASLDSYQRTTPRLVPPRP